VITVNSVKNRNHAIISFLADRLSQQELSFLFCVLLKFELTGDIYCRCTEFDILVCWTFIGNAIMTGNIRGIQISISTGISKKYWSKSIGIAIGNSFFIRYCYWYWQYFLRQVLVLVLPILSKSIVNNPDCERVLQKLIQYAPGAFYQCPCIRHAPWSTYWLFTFTVLIGERCFIVITCYWVC